MIRSSSGIVISIILCFTFFAVFSYMIKRHGFICDEESSVSYIPSRPDSIELRFWADNCYLVYYAGPTVIDLLGHPVRPGYTEKVVVKDTSNINIMCDLLSLTKKNQIKTINPSSGLAPYKDMLQDVDFAIIMHFNTYKDTLAGAWNSQIIQDNKFDYEDQNEEIKRWVLHQISLQKK